METDESAPKEQTVKCLTAKVSLLSFRKSKSLLNRNLKPTLTNTTPLKHSPNLASLELDATVVTISGENQKTSKNAVIPSISSLIQLSRKVQLHWQKPWCWSIEKIDIQRCLGIIRALPDFSKSAVH